jgi:murein DD-endopeptidase MepM/ murein hydrolase activator NlpD
MKIITLLALILAIGSAWISSTMFSHFANAAAAAQPPADYAPARNSGPAFAGIARLAGIDWRSAAPDSGRDSGLPFGDAAGWAAATGSPVPDREAGAAPGLFAGTVGPAVAAIQRPRDRARASPLDPGIGIRAGPRFRLPLGEWQWPVLGPGGAPPEILRGFHPPAQRWLAGHRGVDLAAPDGAPVLAAGPGTVSYAGTLFGQGVVVISHGSVRTSYEPVKPSVHVGDIVARGSPIGTLAAGHCPVSANTGQACLHWGLLAGYRHAVRYYDPLVLLGLSHLRLEPTG